METTVGDITSTVLTEPRHGGREDPSCNKRLWPTGWLQIKKGI